MERFKPIAEITLTDKQNKLSLSVAEGRNKHYEGIHKNMMIKDYATTVKIAATIRAEMACCDLYGWEVNLSTKGPLAHYDTIAHDGRTIDIKSRSYDYADMCIPLNLFLPGYRLDGDKKIIEHADYYALLTGYKLHWKMWGFASFNDVFQRHYYTPFAKKPCLFYPLRLLRRDLYPVVYK